jgi:phage baseplate assembly protein W
MADDRQLLTDLRLALRQSELRPVYSADTDLRRASGTSQTIADIGIVSGQNNLAQAIITRLLTPRGELAVFGHPEYGSRLHELVGRPNTATTRNLIKLYILESLKQESRILKVVELTVTPIDGSRTREDVRHRVDVRLRVTPISNSADLTIGPLILELAP